MEDGVLDEFYNDVIKWATVVAPEGFWGTKEHLEVHLGICKEECITELSGAIEEGCDSNLADALADSFVVMVQLYELTRKIHQSVVFDPEVYTPNTFLSDAIECLEGENYHLTLNTLSTLVATIEASKLPMEKVLREVLLSNWSKLPTTAEVQLEYDKDITIALQKASKWIEDNNDKGYTDIVGKVIDGRCVFRCNGGKGKVVKPFSYFEPDIKGILKNGEAKEKLSKAIKSKEKELEELQEELSKLQEE